MATWVTLTEDDVLSGMTQRERDDFAKTSVGAPVADRISPILTDLVAEIQGMIASRADNPVPPSEDVIPSEFRARAVSLARWRVLISIPGYQPGDARRLDYEKADEFFLRVAEGKIRPRAQASEDAEAPASVPQSGSWNSENRVLGRMNPTPRPGMQGGGTGRYANDDAPSDGV
jgi:phage gp36-like protein